jgi:hypothetical protein
MCSALPIVREKRFADSVHLLSAVHCSELCKEVLRVAKGLRVQKVQKTEKFFLQAIPVSAGEGL